MKIYLCSCYSRRQELCGYREVLSSLGHEITSRWLDTEWPTNERGSTAAPDEHREEYSIKDMNDVQAADCLIAFTEPRESAGGRGGRHVETGMALAWNKRVVVVGHRENIFCYLPQVEFYESWQDVIKAL